MLLPKCLERICFCIALRALRKSEGQQIRHFPLKSVHLRREFVAAGQLHVRKVRKTMILSNSYYFRGGFVPYFPSCCMGDCPASGKRSQDKSGFNEFVSNKPKKRVERRAVPG